MENLSKNWLTEGLIDYEYKKYILLAYLKKVQENFTDRKLYPTMSDLLFHFKNLSLLKENKKLLYENFPKRISRADFEKLEILYEEIVKDDEIMKELENIISFALPKFREHLNTGKDIYDSIEDNISISPVGLCPLDPKVGYMFIYVDNHPETLIFEYQVSIFESADEKYRGIHTNFVDSVRKTLANTFESIKIELIRKNNSLSNPGTYLINAHKNYPFQETLMPIAKRMLIKYITDIAA